MTDAAGVRSGMPRLRPAILDLETQQIMQVSSLGMGDPDVIALWYGESDVASAEFVNRAAAEALAAGHSFYPHKRGIPPLREAIARYNADLYGIDLDVERVTVTSSGMSAIMLILQTLVDPGDNVVLLGPVWPNAGAATQVLGGEPRQVPLTPRQDGAWQLDLDRLFAACDTRTRALFVNSPNNPTGWTMSAEEQRAVLDFARARGLWVIADEVYARIVYGRRAAPSFLEVMAPDDPVLVVNSFSKAWAMTGWRIGWVVHPPAYAHWLANLVEYNTSGTPPFLQYAAATALREGEGFVAAMVARCRAGREVVDRRLAALPRVRYTPPVAAFYAFFALDGMPNGLDFCKRLVREAGVGLAPGTAFGPEAEGWLRLCYARAPDVLETAMDRLEPFLS